MIAQRIWWIYHNYFKQTRALRAHTPRSLHAQHILHLHCHATWTYAVNDLSLHVWGQSCAWAESTCICIVGTANGHGCNGQLKYTICDACRQWHSILSILKLVYRQLQQIRYTYESLGCLDLKIWWFFVDDDNNNDTTDYFTPCACVRGNKWTIIIRALHNWSWAWWKLHISLTQFSTRALRAHTPRTPCNCAHEQKGHA